ncbi:MAG: creatininase family protein [Saprospiraceae bacterium]|nr:creatininase family protein [Saprospiraceae bacterium]
MNEMNSKSLAVLKRLKITDISVEPKRVRATYRITTRSGEITENELIYSYEERLFDPGQPSSINLASIMLAQVAINYGLFFEELVFDGLFDEVDKRFIVDMTENTSREIYVNKFLQPNEFLLPPHDQLKAEKQARYTNAELLFINSQFGDLHTEWSYTHTDKDKFAILSSGGKDSLLTFGIIREINKDPHPVFINESGRHWFTAVNAHRHFKEICSNTAKPWCNSDRIFNWMLRQLPFIRQDFAEVRADIYPIRLWTVAVFLFGVLPVARRRNIGNILIGNEYDTTLKANHQGITHYSALYDQSRYFDNALTRYFMKKGYNIYQYSLLRSLSELLILKVLVKRYPELQRHQVSCHASHEKEGRMYPCGRCEKCRRIIGMLKALDEDPTRCGYTPEQVEAGLKALAHKKVKQIGSDAAHLYHLLLKKGLIEDNEHTRRLAGANPQIEHLRFDKERSRLADIPGYIRKPVLDIFSRYAEGAVQLRERKWQELELGDDFLQADVYPFEVRKQRARAVDYASIGNNFMWEKMTWPELEERLKIVDTAILPCGAVEQHGPHLPVDIDYYDAVYLARKVAEACSDPKPFVLPPIPFGVSYHHQDFKGTLSVSNDALSRFVYDLGMSLAKNGIKKIIILNGHGDNAPTLNYAAQMINRDAHIFVCVDTGDTSDIDLYDLIETPNDIHAGEIETSTSLALRPEMVQMDKAVKETLSFGSSYLDYTSERGVSWYVRTHKISRSGVMGDPTKASAEKGKKMWEIMIAHLVKFVEEVKKSELDALYQKRY